MKVINLALRGLTDLEPKTRAAAKGMHETHSRALIAVPSAPISGQ